MNHLNRYRHNELVDFSKALLEKNGLSPSQASSVSSVLVEGDCLGKSTHGLALLPLYINEIKTGGMVISGAPEVITDFGACLTWDGRKLPGPWLLQQATDIAIDRATKFGIAAVSIQRSHHTACLGAYLRPAVEAGYMMMLAITDPGHSSVAPFGGVTPVLTSNPIAFGAPTDGEPILIDMSTALLTNSTVTLHAASKTPLPYPFMMDNQGQATTDATVINSDPPGSILPLGGLEAGHKGFSLGLIVELLTGCLSGRGRASENDGWSAAAFILVINPAAFGGQESFGHQVEALTQMCRNSALRSGVSKVTLPGESALERRQTQLRDGVTLSATIVSALETLAQDFDMQMPARIA